VTDLASWLRVQFDEEQRLAERAIKASGGRIWTADENGIFPQDDPSNHPGAFLADAYGCTDPGYGFHIARWDPARVLAEIDAKRRILDLHTGGHECSGYDHQGEIDRCRYYHDFEICSTVRLVAVPYAGRPGWQEQWGVA